MFGFDIDTTLMLQLHRDRLHWPMLFQAKSLIVVSTQIMPE